MNQPHPFRNLSKLFLILAAAAMLFAAGAASAGAKPLPGEEQLLDTYHRNLARLETNSFGIPLFLESYERDDRVHVDVYGIFDHSFSSVVNVLKVPANWCDIVSLYPNVKACTYREQPGDWLLTFYLGKKVYQPPEDARQVMFHYRNVHVQPGYLDIVLIEERRFAMRINEWYDSTSHFRKQLFDLEKKDYLNFKTKENTNQETLQRLIVPGLK